MMNRIAEIENHIMKGLVLDEHGNWITIADRKAVEDEFLEQLWAGRVLHEGRWVSIAEVKASGTGKVEIPPIMRRAVARVFPRRTVIVETPEKEPSADTRRKKTSAVPPDTSIIVQTPAPEKNLTDNIQETAETPPETKVIVQAQAPEEETRYGQTIPPSGGADQLPPETKVIARAPDTHGTEAAPPSQESSEDEFAPETKVIYIKSLEQGTARGHKASSPVDTDTKLTISEQDTQFFLRQSIPSWEKSGDHGRKRLLLLGGILITLAGAAAIFIVLKVALHF